MKTTASLGMLLALASAPALAAEDGRDAEIASLRETVERLTRRIEALEAERAPAVAAAQPVPGAAPPPAGAVSVQAPGQPSPSRPVPGAAAVDAMPALAKSPLPEHPTFDEDQDVVARADNVLPPGENDLDGFFLVGDGPTWLRLGGSARLHAMYDSDDAGVRDLLITSAIPVGAQSGQGSYHMHARSTRFTLEARRPTDHGWLRFVLQNDFEGSGGSYGYNLLHAWGQLGNTYAGYGFSAFLDLDSAPDTLDVAGPGAMPFARVASVRRYVPLRNGNQLVFAAEHESAQVSADSGSVRDAMPNLVFAARHEGESGHVQAGALLRLLAWRDPASRDEVLAGGVTVSGAWAAASGDYLTWGGVAGRGIAAYVGDLGGIGLDAVVNGDGSLEPLDEWGGWVGYGHPWSGAWRSTVAYGRLYLQRDETLATEAFRRSDYLAANLIYAPSRTWSWGLELSWGKLQRQDGETGDVLRLQSSLRYDFIK